MVYRRLVTYGEETTYGQTPEDVSRWIGGVTSFNGGVELASEDTAYLSGGRVVQTFVHGLNVSPSIEFYIQSPRFLKYAFGKTTNTGTSPPYTHLLEISDDYELPSATIVEHRIAETSHGYIYNGCRADQLIISWDTDSLVKAAMQFNAIRVSKTTTLPSTTPDTRDFFKSSAKTVEINGVQIAYAVSGSVTINNNHTAFPRSGDFPARHVAGNAQTEAELELYYIDSTAADLMITKTKFDVNIRFTRSQQDYFEIGLEDCVCSVESPLEAEGELMQTVALRPSNISIIAVDDVPAY